MACAYHPLFANWSPKINALPARARFHLSKFAVFKNPWFQREFLDDRLRRVWKREIGRPGIKVLRANTNPYRVDATQLVNAGPRHNVGNSRRTSHTEDCCQSGALKLVVEPQLLPCPMEQTAEVKVMCLRGERCPHHVQIEVVLHAIDHHRLPAQDLRELGRLARVRKRTAYAP